MSAPAVSLPYHYQSENVVMLEFAAQQLWEAFEEKSGLLESVYLENTVCP